MISDDVISIFMSSRCKDGGAWSAHSLACGIECVEDSLGWRHVQGHGLETTKCELKSFFIRRIRLWVWNVLMTVHKIKGEGM